MANIRRNLVYNFLLSFSQVLMPLVSIPYISRVLDPDGIGRVGFIDSFTYYFVVLAEAGIMMYGIREVAKLRDQPAALRQLVSELITLHLVTSAVVLVFYLAGIWLLWEKIGDIRLLIFSVSFLVVNAFACEWYFIGQERFGYIAARSMLIRMSGLLSMFLLIHAPADYYIYYAIIACSAMIAGIWNIAILFRETGYSWRQVQLVKHLRRVWVTYLISLLYSVPLMLDHVLLGLVSTATAVGFYSFSVRAVRVSATLVTDSFLVFFPRIVALGSQRAIDEVQQKLRVNLQFILLLALPMGMGLFLLADDIALYFFGNKFAGVGYNLRILAFFPLLKGFSLFLSNPILIAHHREINFLRNLVVSTGLFVVAALIAGYHAADTGICWSLLGAELVLIALNYRSVSRVLPQLPVTDRRTLLHGLGGVLLFIPVVLLLHSAGIDGWLFLLIAVVSCKLVYFGFLIFVVRNTFAQRLWQLGRSLSFKRNK